MEKTKKLQLEDFTENEFFGTQEQQYLKAQVREELKEQGFIIDSSFEGDFKTWIGVYARPKDKPTYLDPQNDKEAEEQEQYSINGFKQDFSEWFEWEIKNLKIKELQKKKEELILKSKADIGDFVLSILSKNDISIESIEENKELFYDELETLLNANSQNFSELLK